MILEKYFWLSLLKLFDQVAFVVYALALATSSTPVTVANSSLSYSGFITILSIAAALSLFSILILVVSLWATVKVTTTYQILQGWVEHVNAVGVVCAVSTCVFAVKFIAYSNSLPGQVPVPSLAPAYAVLVFSLLSVPFSLFGFYAALVEDPRLLRAYGAVAAVFVAVFVALIIAVGVVVDYKTVRPLYLVAPPRTVVDAIVWPGRSSTKTVMIS